ncbi:MAG: PspC domain-containing protein [Clostridiales bacterium]|nr:PspC domain-containing protein [Clostridiales bacterium]
MGKKLYRSRNNRVLLGVCGGFGEYFDIDPVIVRLLLVVFTLMGGAGIIAYIIAAIVIPDISKDPDYSVDYEQVSRGSNDRKGPIVLGIILILLGAFLLFRNYIPWIPREIVLAVILIAAGIYFIIKRTK